MVITTLNKIPLLHVRFDRVAKYRQTPMEVLELAVLASHVIDHVIGHVTVGIFVVVYS